MHPVDVAFLSDGSMVVQSLIAGAGGIGQPLHVIGADREIVRSFGGRQRWNPRKVYQGSRRLGAASRNQLWAGHAGEYWIELWGADGSLKRSLLRDANWFTPWADRIEGYKAAMRRPRVVDVAEDRDGRLWVHITVPDRNRPPKPKGEGKARGGGR